MKKLSESIWSDMQDRSAGETVRKEDDISLLDNEGLYDYIKSKYESRIPNFNIDMGYYTNKSSNEKDLLIQPYGQWKPLMLYVFYNDGKIGEICTHFDKFKRWNFNILKQKYLLIPDRHYDECNYNFKISEKDGTITNHTVIGIIDILVEDKSKILLESIWSDMQDRSTGETVRKEDEKQHLFDTLTKLYPPTNSTDKIELHDDLIYVPLFKFLNNYSNLAIYDDRKFVKFSTINPSKYKSSKYKKISPIFLNLWKELDDNFTFVDFSDYNGLEHWRVITYKPKDGGLVDEKFCIKIIDCIIDFIDGTEDIIKIVNSSNDSRF